MIKECSQRSNSVIYTLLFVWLFIALGNTQTATISVTNASATVMDKTSLLFGISFDARTSLTGNNNLGQIGYYNADGTIILEIDTLFGDFPLTTLRYPANGIQVGFDWKKSVGSPALRPDQNIMGSLGGPQPVLFGFDEFMNMVISKNVNPAEVQIMVPIYDTNAEGLTPSQVNAAVSNVIAHNADWVEYCNSVNDGNHPWAAFRAANGHPEPYGIKIWNIGNEPWSSQEFGSSAAQCNDYLTMVTPIIDAMRAVDPTIKITMPSTGNPFNSSSWT